MPKTRKIKVPTSEGITEHLLTKRTPSGVWMVETRGFYASPVKRAEPWEIEDAYNSLNLPKVSAIATIQADSTWFCLPLNDNQWRNHIKRVAPTPLLFAGPLSTFDLVEARVFYHRRKFLLFEQSRDLLEQDALRERLQSITFGTDLDGVTENLPMGRELKRAFRLVAEKYVPPFERVVREALRIVEAKLLQLSELGGGRFSVNYEYRGTPSSVIINGNLTCLSSGICLSGHDSDFDLSSVVLVKHRRDQRW